MAVILPSLPEQKAIASFLDRECGKIDALIAEQERLIALLAEKRQAVISHAVTKGLNPNAPMKDSGIPWIGVVPEGWDVVTAGRVVRVISGFAFPSDKFLKYGEGVPLLRGVNVGVGKLRWDDVVYWKRQIDDGLDIYELKEGDIVIGMDRPWISSGLRACLKSHG
ncbi:restriction endonuclease subunit S [Acetobacter orleanensis]|nr:restriction endonuclease subunit S [Acetobacter orleanensis]